MSTKWDLTAYSRDSQLVLVVEVKSKLDATPKWAAQLRGNILVHGTFPNAPYFLMVFPDRFYLWKNIGSNHELIVASWLSEAIHKTPDELDVSQRWLIDSGLHDAIAGESLDREVVV